MEKDMLQMNYILGFVSCKINNLMLGSRYRVILCFNETSRLPLFSGKILNFIWSYQLVFYTWIFLVYKHFSYYLSKIEIRIKILKANFISYTIACLLCLNITFIFMVWVFRFFLIIHFLAGSHKTVSETTYFYF